MTGDYDEEIAVQTSISVAPHVPSTPMTVPSEVDVVAPTALAGGYQFHVNAGVNQLLLVEVVRVVECALLGLDSNSRSGCDLGDSPLSLLQLSHFLLLSLFSLVKLSFSATPFLSLSHAHSHNCTTSLSLTLVHTHNSPPVGSPPASALVPWSSPKPIATVIRFLWDAGGMEFSIALPSVVVMPIAVLRIGVNSVRWDKS
jgi:hypothetical protein